MGPLFFFHKRKRDPEQITGRTLRNKHLLRGVKNEVKGRSPSECFCDDDERVRAGSELSLHTSKLIVGNI